MTENVEKKKDIHELLEYVCVKINWEKIKTKNSINFQICLEEQ